MKKSVPENLKTRPDLDDMTWIIWLQQQPEYKPLQVAELYRKMLEWCVKKGKTPTRLRLLNWLTRECESMPMSYEPAYFEPPSVEVTPDPPCEYCGKENCLLLHREERGI
ncbi:MAG: hypothetical protein IPG22_16370 [Acidobacteria bacterium]|nr:hypothetical protein [Acidobacteriota bacterium]